MLGRDGKILNKSGKNIRAHYEERQQTAKVGGRWGLPPRREGSQKRTTKRRIGSWSKNFSAIPTNQPPINTPQREEKGLHEKLGEDFLARGPRGWDIVWGCGGGGRNLEEKCPSTLLSFAEQSSHFRGSNIMEDEMGPRIIGTKNP